MESQQGTPYYTVKLDEARGFVRITRTGAVYPSLVEMERDTQLLEQIVRRFGVRRGLIDFRQGPPARNDEAFERATEKGRRLLRDGFERFAVLVRSAVGKLQVNRLSREDGAVPHVFLDEAEAIRYLEGP